MSIKEYAAKFGDDYWPYHRSPDALAYDYLDNLCLGWFDRGSEVNEGYLDFVWGPCPGNDSKFVDVDLLGASILQERLIEHGHDVLVKLV